MSWWRFSCLAMVVGLAGTGCEPAPAARTTTFYNLDSLLTAQVAALPVRRASLQKSATVSNVDESVVLESPDSATWATELNIFRQLDLNRKPVNARIYESSRGRRDRQSNLLINEHIGNEDVPVAYLKVYYQGNTGNIRRIEGKVLEENALYSSVRVLELAFADVNDEVLLTGYTVTGGQKMILGDSVTFRIQGNVIHR